MNSKNLILKDISIGFKNNVLMQGINCSFDNNGVNLVIGKSGSGKTTLLKTIAGFHKQNSGKIFLNNNEFKPLGNFALAFQNPEVLFFNPTVGEEILFGLNQKKHNEESKIELGKEWLRKWGLEPDKFWDRHPMSLSGGEQRRVALAACTVFNPEIIMLDEPLAGLDSKGQNDINNVIKALSHESIVIVVTHDIKNLLEIACSISAFTRDKVYYFNSIRKFLKTCLSDDSIYKLPSWYVKEIKKFYKDGELPFPNAESVYKYVKKQAICQK